LNILSIKNPAKGIIIFIHTIIIIIYIIGVNDEIDVDDTSDTENVTNNDRNTRIDDSDKHLNTAVDNDNDNTSTSMHEEFKIAISEAIEIITNKHFFCATLGQVYHHHYHSHYCYHY